MRTRQKSLLVFLSIVTVLSLGFILSIQSLGQKGLFLAQFYMLSPAIAAAITRGFFYENKFKDANLRPGKLRDYFRFWAISLGITLMSFAIFTLLGSIRWDLTGKSFLANLAQQFAATGQDINDTLPRGFTPEMMLWLFFLGGLTVFNILPGIITGFGEEFGWRGFMFPQLYKIKPWVAFVIGGLIWYGWHVPLALILPQASSFTAVQSVLNVLATALGTICAFTFLAYVYVKTENIFVASVAHITLNNSARSFSYFVTIEDQFMANIGLSLTMVIVVSILYYSDELRVFGEYFGRASAETTPDNGKGIVE